MIVKGQLEDAQLELSSDVSLESPKKGRVMVDSASLKVYIGDGSSWRSLASESALGEVRSSMLTEAQYATENGAEWILADGRDVTGSDYATATGNTTVPDLRGVFLRGKDHGTGVNPDGDLALGTFTDDKYEAHSHPYTDEGYPTFGTGAGVPESTQGNQWFYQPNVYSRNTTPSGGNETAPKSVTVNYFIKIYRDLGL